MDILDTSALGALGEEVCVVRLQQRSRRELMRANDNAWTRSWCSSFAPNAVESADWKLVFVRLADRNAQDVSRSFPGVNISL